jgi:hypothetical protein
MALLAISNLVAIGQDVARVDFRGNNVGESRLFSLKVSLFLYTLVSVSTLPFRTNSFRYFLVIEMSLVLLRITRPGLGCLDGTTVALRLLQRQS